MRHPPEGIQEACPPKRGFVRNVFDQYEQAENRLTHALAIALHEDGRLLRDFISHIARVAIPRRAQLRVLEQGVSGEEDLTEKELERRGLPDIWICDDDESWCLLVENKLTARLKADQLRRHLGTARRRGFTDVHLIALTPKRESMRLPRGCQVIGWKQIYSWLRRHERRSEWAARAAEYLEVLEGRMSEQEFDGALTEFTGFRFSKDRPWNYNEAKQVLRHAMDELRKRRDLVKQLGMDPAGRGRKAITGKGSRAVWDFLSLRTAAGRRQHTETPHLTLSISDERVWAHLTCPNQFRRRVGGRRGLEQEELWEILERVERNLRPIVARAHGAVPWFDGVQRHYRTQRSEPIIDGRLEFDLRAIARKPPRSRVKSQPVWLEAAWSGLRNRKPNFQMSVGLVMPFKTCPMVRERVALDCVAEAWIATRPLLDAMLERGE